MSRCTRAACDAEQVTSHRAMPPCKALPHIWVVWYQRSPARGFVQGKDEVLGEAAQSTLLVLLLSFWPPCPILSGSPGGEEPPWPPSVTPTFLGDTF